MTNHKFRVVTWGNALFKVQFLFARTEKHIFKEDQELETWHDVVFYNDGPPLFSCEKDAVNFMRCCKGNDFQGEWKQVGEIV